MKGISKLAQFKIYIKNYSIYTNRILKDNTFRRAIKSEVPILEINMYKTFMWTIIKLYWITSGKINGEMYVVHELEDLVMTAKTPVVSQTGLWTQYN